ncbi:uncharacterized protein EV420DRAFT_310224 [Desarmillaria tabescens]|uniref:Uncharacterized protein n=1 Tax=Armillaria tabescens TaxID=1929756 RepID=A0AA39KHY6_ARMTA|nr:uncharacterized protein EV420DRAFT_310224 [Desarmillaria tabescens]KAK0459238.1 hypothetical protein EV420DRAFT_310224 [Desarmillaria tabescens]
MPQSLTCRSASIIATQDCFDVIIFRLRFLLDIARGTLLLFRDHGRALTPFGRPCTSARVTSSYQHKIIKSFKRIVPGAKKKRVTEYRKAVGITHTVLCYIGLAWIPEDGLANRSGKLDLASIKDLAPGVILRYEVNDSSVMVRLHALETRVDTGEYTFLMRCEEVQAYRSFNLDLSTSCFDAETKTLISAILKMVQECLLNIPVPFTTSSQGDDWVDWVKACNTLQEVYAILSTTVGDAEREDALNLLRDRLSVLYPQSVD